MTEMITTKTPTVCPWDKRKLLRLAIQAAAITFAETLDEWSDEKVARYYESLANDRLTLDLDLD